MLLLLLLPCVCPLCSADRVAHRLSCLLTRICLTSPFSVHRRTKFSRSIFYEHHVHVCIHVFGRTAKAISERVWLEFSDRCLFVTFANAFQPVIVRLLCSDTCQVTFMTGVVWHRTRDLLAAPSFPGRLMSHHNYRQVVHTSKSLPQSSRNIVCFQLESKAPRCCRLSIFSGYTSKN